MQHEWSHTHTLDSQKLSQSAKFGNLIKILSHKIMNKIFTLISTFALKKHQQNDKVYISTLYLAIVTLLKMEIIH
jgi:hypothetical protein